MPRSLPERLLRRAVIGAYDLTSHVADLRRIHFGRQHLVPPRRLRGESIPRGPVRRIAIVSTFPSAASAVFTVNLLRLLAEREFLTVLVSTKPLTEAEQALFAPLVAELVERPNAGRDFRSYQWALRDLAGASECLAQAEHLLLANDSLYWPKSFGAEFDRMLTEPIPWQGLFENHQYHYHLGSFFQLYSSRVFAGDAFRGFWARYRAYDSRKHVVNRGEVGLSAALRAAGLVPGVAYSAPRLAAALQERELHMDWLPTGGFPGLRRQDVAERIRRTCPQAAPGQLPATLQASLAAEFVQAFQTQNPTQIGALACNVLFGAPLKRDLAYRGVFDMQQLVTAAEGFDAEERTSMLADLRNRGLAASLTPLRRVLADAGRL